jgi:predicted alpha/beta hydrolase
MSKVLPLVAAIVGHFPGRKFGFGGREAHQLVKDWAYSVVTGNYIAAGYCDDKGRPYEFEPKIEVLDKQALLITVDQDTLAPQASIKNLGDKLARSEITYHHLEAQDFINDSLGHFNWMKEPEPIVQKIKQWLYP